MRHLVDLYPCRLCHAPTMVERAEDVKTAVCDACARWSNHVHANNWRVRESVKITNRGGAPLTLRERLRALNLIAEAAEQVWSALEVAPSEERAEECLHALKQHVDFMRRNSTALHAWLQTYALEAPARGRLKPIDGGGEAPDPSEVTLRLVKSEP